MRYTVLAAAAGLLVACNSPLAVGGVPRQAAAVAAEDIVLTESAWSGYPDAERRLITSNAEWAAVWQQIYQPNDAAPPLPAVDFETHVVILAAMGTRPTGGYSVRIREVRAHEDVLYVSVLERSPGETCGTYQAITAPVHVVKVPRAGTTAQFQVSRETYQCD